VSFGEHSASPLTRLASDDASRPLPAKERGEVCVSVSAPTHLVPKNFFGASLRELQPGGTCETNRRYSCSSKLKEADMGFGRGALLWLIGIPLPIILILALFMHH
jgi:hypothetical protein